MKPESLFGQLVCVRTNNDENHQPCDEAILVKFTLVQRLGVDFKVKDEWYRKGRNHRVENDMNVREMDSIRWVVNIPDIQALKQFFDKYGPVIISINNDGIDPCYELEIYDDHRE